MAKPFYSMEEVCEKLGKSEEEIRAMVREGQLREFRDAGKVFFKAEEVEKLSGGPGPAAGESGEIALEPAEEEELPSLGDDPSTGTSILGLAPEEEPEEKSEEEKKEGTVITASGIGVFDDEELEIDADPMAATQVTTPSADDHVSLEGSGSGSGSGLLDLQREADDTSLGAELLDEIYPGEEEQEGAPPAPAEEPVAEAEPEPEPELPETTEVAPPPVAAPAAAAGDTSEGLFDGLLIGGLLLLVFASSVAAANLQQVPLEYAATLTQRFWFFLGGAALLPIITLVVGWAVGRASAR